MFDRPQSGTRAVLVHLDFRSEQAQESVEEFHQLATSAGVESVARIHSHRNRPDPRLLIGSGKAVQVSDSIKENQAELALFNHELTPVQERNLERKLECRVVDRTGLILDIFAQRARTFEGKLQVELAQLKHLSTRLVRGWSHLERQKGGIGLRGPGETQLETDRRLIGQRIKQLNKRLDKVRKQRELRRHSRRKATLPVVSLVGYTNAGKSTLFNGLTGAEVFTADQLFATLDPTLRRLEIPALGPVVVADTVGFIRDLPPHLVAAFRATLEETVQADLLLHVIDAHDEDHAQQIEEVNQILSDIGADEIPQIEVYNKIDRRGSPPRIDRDCDGAPRRVWVSAANGKGLDLLGEALAERLLYIQGQQPGAGQAQARVPTHGPARLRLAPGAGRLRAQLFEWNVVVHETTNSQGEWIVDVVLKPGMLGYLQRQGDCRIAFEDGAAKNVGACDKLGGDLQSATV